MKYKVFAIKREDKAEELLNKYGKQGYRAVPGLVIVLGGKTCLVMEKGESQVSIQAKEPASEQEPAKKDPPVKKISEDSVEVK